MSTEVPQPQPSRLTPFAGGTIVVGVVPGQPELVALTAQSLALATGATVYFAYADPRRIVDRELDDGSVLHSDLDPDLADEVEWRRREAELVTGLRETLGDSVPWDFRYLAGRADRALTHLARSVDAAVIVVGGGAAGAQERIHHLLEGSVASHLSHHQHRPVLVVPLRVVDWKTPLG
ncbi:universal stress protein [Nostocoides sp. F2B08]|uniref:universal stress protein n=1 Tax=Nostocoides sp. F2B08 TaxID=2653936 RepID=UPI001262D663|nr:universal stress protein [Tetrasphaera sp. F2B08]KAB7744000.1 universal stress protein [Tetrasphaera sp. F2B08]